MAVLEFGLKGFERGFFASYLPPRLGIILLIFSLVALLSYLKPLSAINVAYNKVRIPGIVTFFMGIGNFLLAVMIPYLAGWNYYGVALAGAIVLTLKNAFFTPWYATKILGISKTTFLNSMIPGVFAMAVTAGVSRVVANYFQISGLIPLLASGIVLTMIYMYSIWTFIIENKERKIIEKSLPFSRNNWSRKM
jgi:membrane protein EpsK